LPAHSIRVARVASDAPEWCYVTNVIKKSRQDKTSRGELSVGCFPAGAFFRMKGARK